MNISACQEPILIVAAGRERSNKVIDVDFKTWADGYWTKVWQHLRVEIMVSEAQMMTDCPTVRLQRVCTYILWNRGEKKQSLVFTLLRTHKEIPRWYPSRHSRSLSVLHCVMESDTPCASLVLAQNMQSAIPETAVGSESASPLLSRGSARRAVHHVGGLLRMCRCFRLHETTASSAHFLFFFFFTTFSAPSPDFNHEHMWWLFTKHGSLIKTSFNFIQTVCMVSFAYTHKPGI